MADHSETLNPPEPSDIERTQVLSRLIFGRIAELEQLRTERVAFTPPLARELFVLQHLRDDWLLEGKRQG